MQPAVPLKTSLVLGCLSLFWVLSSGLWLWTRNTAQRRNKFWTAASRKSTRMQNPSTQRKDNESLLNLSNTRTGRKSFSRLSAEQERRAKRMRIRLA
ncbi:hypothetical protein ACLKA7_001683 [Drosophila subpalustris]